jgi:uncharacterized protein (TIGR00369 family)
VSAPEELAARIAERATAVPHAATFDGVLGIRIEELTPTAGRASLPVTDALLGLDGTVHSGVHAAVAESIASWATGVSVAAGQGATGMSNTTTVLAGVRDGELQATATRRGDAPGEWTWDVLIATADGTPAATSTVVVAVRTLRPA